MNVLKCIINLSNSIATTVKDNWNHFSGLYFYLVYDIDFVFA